MQPIKTGQPPAIFGPTPKVIKASETLLRIVKLNGNVWEDSRPQYIKELRNALTVFKEKASVSIVDAKEDMADKLCRFEIDDIYGQELAKANTVDGANHFIKKLMKDIDSITFNPLKKSTRGQKGPTFLVSYSRPNKLDEPKLHCYVMKWTHLNELCCTRIYSVFSRFISNGCNSSPFLVPDVCGFDFEKDIHEMFDATQTIMGLQEKQAIMNTFNGIAKVGAPKHKMPDKLVMLCERINGENLFDFALTKYEHLPRDEKIKLLTQLGQIAMLDLLTGNLDRIVQIWFNPEEDSYGLLDCEANLGNIMVRWVVGEEKKPVIYAIDNGIQPELIEDGEHVKKYQAFLNALFSDPHMEDKLVNNIVKSFKHAIATQGDDLSSKNTKELQVKLQAFSNDIQELGGECFRVGLRTMSSLLQSTLLPQWNGEQGAPWRNYLSTTYPKLLDAIQFRFNEFTTKRIL